MKDILNISKLTIPYLRYNIPLPDYGVFHRCVGDINRVCITIETRVIAQRLRDSADGEKCSAVQDKRLRIVVEVLRFAVYDDVDAVEYLAERAACEG